jgi:hypothetical protein
VNQRQKKSGASNHTRTAHKSDDYSSSSNSIIADKVFRVTGCVFMLIGLLLVFLAAAGTDGRMETPGIWVLGISGLFTAVLGMVLISMRKVVSKDD